MIISHKHKFVFVKTTKTAGTSVEIALTKFCGDDDVITILHEDDEAIKRARGLRGPQNDSVTLDDGTEVRLNNHAPATRARRVIGAQAWKDYFTFAFERNPYDRIVSAYHHMKRTQEAKGTFNPALTLPAYVQREKPVQGLHDRGWGLYTARDQIIVDKVYKFEDLGGAMTDILDRLGLTDDEGLLQTKTSQREKGYQQYYDDASRAVVERICGPELDAFGYTF